MQAALQVQCQDYKKALQPNHATGARHPKSSSQFSTASKPCCSQMCLLRHCA